MTEIPEFDDPLVAGWVVLQMGEVAEAGLADTRLTGNRVAREYLGNIAARAKEAVLKAGYEHVLDRACRSCGARGAPYMEVCTFTSTCDGHTEGEPRPEPHGLR